MTLMRALLTVVVAAAIAVAAFTGPFAGIAILGIAGGGIIAAILHWKLLHFTTLPPGGDPFAGRGPTEIVNVSSIRVAGIGGFGLVLVALALVFRFEQAAWLMFYGVVGGALIAALLVVRRRRLGVLPSSGDRGNSMLIERTEDETAAPADGRVAADREIHCAGLTAQGSASALP